jgi:hypothetical protein
MTFNIGDIVKLKKVKNAIFQYPEKDTYGVILNTIVTPNEVEYMIKWFDSGAVGQFNEYLLLKAQ